MTRAELIRRISKQSGIPDSEMKVFFEIFLKRLTSLLKVGQALLVKDFGYFYFIQGKISKSLISALEDVIEQDYEIIEMIYFSKLEIKDTMDFNGLLFNIPAIDEDEFNSVDAAFSLSFGKPLIPFKGIAETEFYIPHTGSELRRLIESKVEKTVVNSKITEVSDVLTSVIDLESESFISIIEKYEDESASSLLEEFESDKDISKQIIEEEILDLADTKVSDDEPKILKPSLHWNFESFDKVKKEDERKPKGDESDKIKIDYEKVEAKLKSFEKISESKKETEEKSEKFERVKDLDKTIDEKVEKTEITFPKKSKEEFEPEFLKEEPVKLKFDRKSSEFIELEPKHKPISRSIASEKNKKQDKIFTKKKTPDFRLIEEEKQSLRERHKRKSSSITPYIMLIVSIGIIAYGVYYYINNIKGFGKKTVEETEVKFNLDKMNVVERDFDFPVTYPYPKRTEAEKDVLTIFDIQKEEPVITKPEEPVKKPVEEKPTETRVETTQNLNSQPPSGAVKRIDVNIFQYGNVYIVQVAAFRSNSVAENEAGRFRNKGYNAFVERAEVNGTIWHRVKVGNFTNLDEAKKLAVQFK